MFKTPRSFLVGATLSANMASAAIVFSCEACNTSGTDYGGRISLSRHRPQPQPQHHSSQSVHRLVRRGHRIVDEFGDQSRFYLCKACYDTSRRFAFKEVSLDPRSEHGPRPQPKDHSHKTIARARATARFDGSVAGPGVHGARWNEINQTMLQWVAQERQRIFRFVGRLS